MITEFIPDVARQVEAELKAKYPDNQWTGGYLVNIIELCCRGNWYFLGHHGAFTAYLDKRNLWRRVCLNCDLVEVVSKEAGEFCSEACELEYYGGQP